MVNNKLDFWFVIFVVVQFSCIINCSLNDKMDEENVSYMVVRAVLHKRDWNEVRLAEGHRKCFFVEATWKAFRV